MPSVDRLGIFEHLRHSIQLLACPAKTQLKLLPHIVIKADELALDFDLWKEAVLNNFRSELSSDQLSSMEGIDHRLAELTQIGPNHWAEDAVRDSEEWKHLRTLASEALKSFGWASETPPSHADEYVAGK
jgi:hypothetical protein